MVGGVRLLNTGDFTYNREKNMLTGGISRMHWECTGKGIHSSWKDLGSFIQEVLFELA